MFGPDPRMETRVYRIKDKSAASKVLDDDRVKKTGYIVREFDGAEYVYLKADEEVFRILEESGAFERPENEEDIKKKIEETEESANAGVSFLGF